ncbi:hypothetical protein F7725_022125 [Dissostichus mawsoni]|uniref:NOT2/NOT3/NOT5 C-terminal domain-containing protein n=1 Tax=Dissostichus mawsoni TaxID=36200 RepID=A0A7J5ZDM0_DISMA|nr:hypothetical protein F7725_022125 [Dissostichus mawsoni]
MFGANRKKFMEGGIDNDYAEDSSLYYTQQSMFPPHRPDKDCSGVSHAWDEQQCSAAVKSKWIKPTRKPTPKPRQHSEHRHDAHTPLTQQGILPMNTRSVLNHSQQVGGPTAQSGGWGGGGGGRSSSMGSPSRSSPSIIGMPKQQQARQPFTINSMSGFGVNRNPGYNMNSSLSNNIFNGTDGSENVTGLDLSDFPALADRIVASLTTLSSMFPVGMVTKPSNEQSQDFSIHNEDFPALPGPNYQSKDPSSTSEDSKTNLNSSGKPASNSDETDPGMVHLALGSDLTTLGLNLNSPENLYPKFASPWASAPCRPQDIDFHVPSEYLTNIHIRDKVFSSYQVVAYGEDLLFYLYYMNGGDLLQLLAAVELFNRDWRYHKEEREFHLEYEKLEERPHVPSTFNYNPAQQAF